MKYTYYIGFVILLVIGLYLNRAYAHVYNTIGDKNLDNPNMTMEKQTFKALKPEKGEIRLVVLGDSLSAGVGAEKIEETYPYLLASKLNKTGPAVELTNLGIPGARTIDVLESELPAAVAAKPTHTMIFIGVNDMHGSVPENQFISNLTAIIRSVQQKTSAKIVLVNIPFIGNSKLMLPPYKSYFLEKTKRYNAILRMVAAEQGVPVVDLFSINKALDREPSFYSADNFHPSAAGYAAWAEKIYAHRNFFRN